MLKRFQVKTALNFIEIMLKDLSDRKYLLINCENMRKDYYSAIHTLNVNLGT